MHLATPVVFLLLFATITIAIEFDGGKGGGRRRLDFSDSSLSSSSEEHRHRPPHRPRPPRPSRPTTPRGECDDGWLRFERDHEIWITNAMLTQPTAETLCQTMGATLTGYQNDNERVTTANEALKKLVAAGQSTIAATNVPACRYQSCGPYNTFTWTDGHTNGTAGFSKWGVGQPDNRNYGGPTICLQQFIMTPNWVGLRGDLEEWRAAFTNGDLDRYGCLDAPGLPQTKMYACGKVGVSRRSRG
ncbi:C-type lectin domain-containing protein [Caenorhabditis elegans]|uniref:C-type lectin domain-containing protein n=1 Tax=Caenorhabditis elegans TaxID=6239 RepID=G5ECM8_CAEEL|nr:C-type lectin domain-containing protein [Caenorhabditis elegans]CAB02973.1 C-type lectin domain-containing protein [Caenorhabditis elegans]|eukprot:NP_493312.1 C-type LECtin [Caenorhabditis elegans]